MRAARLAKGAVREEAEQVARRIAGRAPIAVTLHKTMIDRALDSPLEAALSHETEAIMTAAGSLDRQQGASAFVEKREPRFEGE